ncbi:MAG TPA: hypothetical protein VFV38_11720 [Ktedonobacteraceae bacterium]|nr:hypothetical protein [Ktedonobacteraceae bacterium]
MDEITKAFYEMKFRDCYREKNGNAFQDFFSDIMERCYPNNFQRIHAGGRIGDKKCDGYLRTEHTLF